MPMTALGTPPSRADPANFAARSDVLFGALPTFVTEANALEIDVVAQAAAASAAASSAANAATAALSSAQASGAVLWVSGTTYTVGQGAISPANLLLYRRLTAGAGTTDPSLDAANWQLSSALPDQAGNAGLGLVSDGQTAAWDVSEADALAILNFIGF